MGRDTTADNTPLLKNAEQNIGNSFIIRPQVGAPTTVPQTNPDRLLQLAGGSAAGQTTSVIYTVSRIVGQDNPNPGYPGPITGIIEFGSGGRYTRAEFDVPVGPFLGTNLAALNASEPQDGGIIITVPTSVVRAYMRYDNLLIQPIINAPVPGVPTTLADLQGVPLLGPGGPLDVAAFPPPSVIVPAEPVLGKAMAAYFSRPCSKVYKTEYCYVGRSPLDTVLVSKQIASRVGIEYTLPPFARNLKVLRMPITAALTVSICGITNGYVDEIDIPSGTAPVIPIIGQEHIISIVSKTDTDVVSFLALCCEIGI